jgi:hypothetical protein
MSPSPPCDGFSSGLSLPVWSGRCAAARTGQPQPRKAHPPDVRGRAVFFFFQIVFRLATCNRRLDASTTPGNARCTSQTPQDDGPWGLIPHRETNDRCCLALFGLGGCSPSRKIKEVPTG